MNLWRVAQGAYWTVVGVGLLAGLMYAIYATAGAGALITFLLGTLMLASMFGIAWLGLWLNEKASNYDA